MGCSCSPAVWRSVPWPLGRRFAFNLFIISSNCRLSLSLSNHRNSVGAILSYRYGTILPKLSIRYPTPYHLGRIRKPECQRQQSGSAVSVSSQRQPSASAVSSTHTPRKYGFRKEIYCRCHHCCQVLCFAYVVASLAARPLYSLAVVEGKGV